MAAYDSRGGDRGSRGIAIVGMACVFPGAHSPEDLWKNVLAGRREFRRLPDERMPRDHYFDEDPAAPLRTYSDQMAVISGWRFDPVEFRIPPVTVDASDLSHWLALHTARAALQDAGLELASLDRARVGVMLGNTLGGEFSRSHNLKLRWPHVERAVRAALGRSAVGGEAADGLVGMVKHYYQSRLPDITEDSLAGNMSNTIAGRIAGYFDLGGGAFTLDGACSSSLLAVTTACNAILDGELDYAVAGGVDVSLDPFELVGFAKARALAREDIRPYDQHAAGMLPGEGCGLFVLMREDEARRGGYRIRAVLRGWGVSSDGAGGITAPEVEGQQRALRKAYERAGYGIGDVGLIEGHGTGTPLGDRVELTAIGGLLDAAPEGGPLWIGSIKGNIGHCKAAAGAAGLVKAVMALERRMIPPTGGCRTPTPVLGRPLGRLRPALHGRPWLTEGAPRRASVSAMGFGGANAHVTLEEAHPGGHAADEDLALLGSAQDAELIVLAAPDEARLLEGVRRVAGLADRISRSELVDLAAALAGRAHEGVRNGEAVLRVAVMARSPWHLSDRLRAVVDHLDGGGSLAALVAEDVAAGECAVVEEVGTGSGTHQGSPKLVALYPGQGAQRLGMGEHLLRRHSWARTRSEEMEGAVDDVLGRPLGSYVHRDPTDADDDTAAAWDAELRDTRVAQPAIVAASLLTLEALRRLGLEPDLHLGHSLGEVSALAAAGAMDPVTAVRVAGLRGRAMAGLDVPDPGLMLAVAAAPERVEALVAELPGVEVSNYNAPRQTVAAGSSTGIVALEARCAAEGLAARRIPVSHAFHSGIVAPAAERLAEDLEEVTFRPLEGTVVSSSTGDVLAADTDLPSLLGQHVRLPVRFVDAVRRAAEFGPTLWVEVGPGGILSSLVRSTLGAGVACVPADASRQDGFDGLGRVCAEAFVRGLDVRLEALFADRYVRPFDVDGYDPELIVNPCERPVGEPPKRLEAAARQAAFGVAGGTGLPGLLPEGVEPAAFGGYLERRGDFLRRLVALDFAHAEPSPSSSNEAPPTLRETSSPESGGETVTGADEAPEPSLDRFAIEWIATRTGFPVSSIRGDMRLRDDLNLDSIKMGELWITLSRRVGKELIGDPAAMANATIAELVATLEIPAGAPDAERAAFSGALGLDTSWVETFRTEVVELPLGSPGAQVTLRGRVALFAEGGADASPALVEALEAEGLAVVRPHLEDLDGAPPPGGLAAVVMLLPNEDRSFLECDAVTFEARMRRVSDDLYHTLRWAMRSGSSDLRCLVVRPAGPTDAAGDLDGGAGLLRTFFLENPGSMARWIRVPSAWSGTRVAGVITRELSQAGQPGDFTYDEAGIRRTEIAVPLDAPDGDGLRLGPEDVVLVTGGGKGITAELALELARTTGARLALAGSSAPPASDADPAADELARTFERLREAGVGFTYVRCDVTDAGSVRGAVEEAEASLGPVTALIHGAGVTQFAALRDKPLAEFRRCVAVKVHGLHNLLRVLDPARLKAVHVLSSVLGRTGMRSQSDYTLANAWLDRAVAHLASRYPHLHALSLGYSVWAGTGLGDRLGALDYLETVGVTPIPIPDGVTAYMRVLRERHPGTAFVVTGRLSPDLEIQLYGPTPSSAGRYLERVRRWVPGTELVADARLSFQSDPYLPEHVYEGTPLLPGVMAMEAMAQAASAMLGTDRRPDFRDVRFHRPLIVRKGDEVVMRVLASREQAEVEGPAPGWVHVRIRSDVDGFQVDHFSGMCVYEAGGTETAESSLHSFAAPPSFDGPGVPVDGFVPVPLFQGDLFRHIQGIHHLEPGTESLTTIRIPDVRYFGPAGDERLRTGSPAARDSFLQSGALLLPPGTLPRALGELRSHRVPKPGEIVRCHVVAAESPEPVGAPDGPTVHRADYRVYDAEDRLVEEALGLILETPLRRPRPGTGGDGPAVPDGNIPTPIDSLPAALASTLSDVPHVLTVLRHQDVPAMKVSHEGRVLAGAAVPGRVPGAANAREPSAAANRMAATAAAAIFLRDQTEDAFVLHHDAAGRPLIVSTHGGTAPGLDGMDVSLADTGGYSVAFLAPGRVGVDLEPVEPRDPDLWRSLLGPPGFRLAEDLLALAGGTLDQAATMAWSIREAAKKATGEESRDVVVGGGQDGWIHLDARTGAGAIRSLATLTRLHDGADAAFSVVIAENA